MAVTLGEEIALLSLDDESGAAKERSSAGWAAASGALLELAMAERVSVAEGRLAVIDTSPTGTALLDGRLELLREWTAHKSPRKVTDWLTKDQSKAVAATVESLCGRGLVSEERSRVLGLFPVRRYPEADGSVERELRARLESVVLDGAEPDVRTGGLVALLHAAKLHRIAFPGVDRGRVEPRMAEIAEGQWAGDGVREAIRNTQAAMVAVTATTVAVVLI
ncbi:GPP34 family phosphoprotein [Streptomyces sp. NPDC046887]|uniref:GOLPH3/VPS74 family protein n=1 Tax=Streptomyces sp. NPDC046887 TaxID=3155472 RepID=UPI00340D58F3